MGGRGRGEGGEGKGRRGEGKLSGRGGYVGVLSTFMGEAPLDETLHGPLHTTYSCT